MAQLFDVLTACCQAFCLKLASNLDNSSKSVAKEFDYKRFQVKTS